MNPFPRCSGFIGPNGEDSLIWENTLRTKVLIIDDDVPMTDLMRLMLIGNHLM